MTNTNDSSAVCPHCGAEVQIDQDFCADCGEIFAENVVCHRHSAKLASGVCIVCCMPFCPNCGGRVQNRFLCDEHDNLEIFEDMARVFGSSNVAEVEFAKTSLETAGLHPFVFSRKASPISMGAPDYTLYRSSGEYDGHIVNEFKLMVPCQEVQTAVKKLHELRFLE
jgi:hypothetical protein